MRLLVLAIVVLAAQLAAAQERPIKAEALRSGLEYTGADVRAMQADDATDRKSVV